VSNFINVSRQTSITAILAVGQTFVIIAAGIDLSVGAVAALSASVAAVLMTQQIQIAGRLLARLIFGRGGDGPVGRRAGRICQWPGYHPRPYSRFYCHPGHDDGLSRHCFAHHRWSPDSLAPDGHRAERPFARAIDLVGSGDILGVPVAALVALAVGAAGWFILRYTAQGRAIFAVGGNREAARVSGINIDRTKIVTYTLAGLIAGIAGIVLMGRLNSANALMADGEELRSIASVVIAEPTCLAAKAGWSAHSLAP